MTQRSIRRPLPEPPRVRERPHRVRVCGGVASRVERTTRCEEMTSWGEDGEEVACVPGPTEVMVRFERGGERCSLEWSVRDHRHRARYRQLERRFFASIRCASE